MEESDREAIINKAMIVVGVPNAKGYGGDNIFVKKCVKCCQVWAIYVGTGVIKSSGIIEC